MVSFAISFLVVYLGDFEGKTDLNIRALEVVEELRTKRADKQDAQKCKGRKTTEFWDVKTIESDGTIKQIKLNVKEAMKPPNGRKVVLRKFLDYRNSEETQEKCKKNAENRSKQLYTHTGGSKSLARLGEEESERQGRIVSRGELYLLTHKRTNGSYIHDAARAIGERIEAIEQGDESSRLLSQNDSLAQALGKEHSGRVRGMGLGPTSSQVFGMNSHQPSNGFEREETQRVLLKLQAELAAEKLKKKVVEDEVAAEKTKRQAMEDEVAAEKTKRHAVEDEVAAGKVRMQAMESALLCLLQGQGRKLPSDVATWMSALEGQNRK
ncbi:uncharacterized protein LOC107626790 [Arachis ipaensis]|uniref:uncharacterized protein LOC107626790 n=1 Tax=Arachis ipaensis TaxID=130454 RepID=UPI000A2B1388|nr:uncharacterized protein LOC107626790 [Arachis ipaensis]